MLWRAACLNRVRPGTARGSGFCETRPNYLNVTGAAFCSLVMAARASSLASNRFRSFVALMLGCTFRACVSSQHDSACAVPVLKHAARMLGPLVVIETVLHWFQGTHFPLTASRSFFIAPSLKSSAQACGELRAWKMPSDRGEHRAGNGEESSGGGCGIDTNLDGAFASSV